MSAKDGRLPCDHFEGSLPAVFPGPVSFEIPRAPNGQQLTPGPPGGGSWFGDGNLTGLNRLGAERPVHHGRSGGAEHPSRLRRILEQPCVIVHRGPFRSAWRLR